ncbi:MAG: hypothetical protein NTV22_02340 [bacterium]|nr:hypothetical protein [bacterium]
MARLQATGGVVRTRATGPDAWLGVALDGVAASNVTHLVVRMRSNQSGVCQVYYATDSQSQYAQPFVPTFDCPGDNVFHEFVVALDELSSRPGMLRYVRLDPVNSAGGEAAEIELDAIRLVDKPACPLATSFAPARAWVRRGERVTLRMEIMNVGGGALPPLDVRLRTAHGPGLPGTLMADPRGGAARQVYTWMVQPRRAGLQQYRAELQYAGRAPALVETLVLTVAPDAVPAPSGRRACARNAAALAGTGG